MTIADLTTDWLVVVVVVVVVVVIALAKRTGSGHENDLHKHMETVNRFVVC